MKLILSCIFILMASFCAMSQGYLSKKRYVSTETLHPIAEATNINISAATLFNRFYAFELQLGYHLQHFKLYNYYQISLPGFVNGRNEYLMGKVKCEGMSTRLTFRNFKMASIKAAPVGWYTNYSIEFMRLNFKGPLETQNATGYNSYGNFNINKGQIQFDQSISFYSFRIAAGKSILLNSKFFIDLGIEVGIRSYQLDDSKWKYQEHGIYPIDPLFQNKINRYYLYRDNKEYVKNNYLDLIYEPIIKIGYLF